MPRAEDRWSRPRLRRAPQGSGLAFDPLLDRAEDAGAVTIQHLDPDHVAERHERRRRLAVLQGLHGAPLGEAGGALAGVLVGDRARADDGACRQRSRLRRVRDQLREIELHVDAGLGRAEPFAIDVGQQRQVQLVVAPGIAQFVRGHEDRRQGRARLRLQEAEALGQFARDQVAQADTSLTRPTSWMCAAACSGVTAIGTSSVMTTISASRSMPWASSTTRTGSRGP